MVYRSLTTLFLPWAGVKIFFGIITSVLLEILALTFAILENFSASPSATSY